MRGRGTRRHPPLPIKEGGAAEIFSKEKSKVKEGVAGTQTHVRERNRGGERQTVASNNVSFCLFVCWFVSFFLQVIVHDRYTRMNDLASKAM